MIIRSKWLSRLLGSCLVCFISTNATLGQTSRYFNTAGNFPKKTVSFGMGVSSYYGDIQSLVAIPHHTFFVEYSNGLDEHVVSKTTLLYYKVGASDSDASGQSLTSRNLSFQANNIELSTALEFRLFKARNEKRFLFNPYMFVGAGVSTNNPFTKFNGKKVSLRSLRTEGVGYSNLIMVFPIGGGLRITPLRSATLILEAGYRFTNTDYLDDVSTIYPSPDLLSDLGRQLSDRGPEAGFDPAKPGGKRGESGNKDGYLIMNMKIEINLRTIFQYSGKKPKFR